MRWLQTEYVLKGIYLGLLLFVALQEPDWRAGGRVALCTLGGLGIALAIAAIQKLREGYRVRGRLAAFLLFLLLECPGLVYGGILLGMAAGAFWIRTPDEEYERLLTLTVGGGAALGVVFSLLRLVPDRRARIGLNLLLAVGLVAGALALFGWPGQIPGLLELSPTEQERIGYVLLLGIPVFYLLTFAGIEEESEVEIGASCALLGLAIALLNLTPRFQWLGFLLPLALYYVYTMRILPGLRVFKHSLRGMSYARVGRYRQALVALRRALELDPHNELAREAFWGVHRVLELPHLAGDRATLELVDFDLCLERAGSLLLNPGPSAERLAEAHRLLDLVLSQRPELRPKVCYWRAVAFTHARDYDRATHELAQVLDPTGYAADDLHRRAILLPAWQLALLAKEELRHHCGLPQLALPRRRLEAIGAVERLLAEVPDEAGAWGLKRILYQDLTEADYDQAASPGEAAADFDHAYAEQLGLALVNDPARWQRGCEYLQLAARGLPLRAPLLFIQIAQAYQRAGQVQEAWHAYRLAKRAGQAVGPKNLPDEDRHAYFAAIKQVGEAAVAQGDHDTAIEYYRHYTEYERSGVETLRTLAELHERKGDPLSALRCTDQALVFNAKDQDLLDRKDRYYYSVDPEHLRSRLEAVRNGFDTAYCLTKARSLLDLKNADPELLDWALHLLTLAQVVQPESVTARVLLARTRLRRGEKEEALALLEDVYNNRPEKFASGEDQDSWYVCCRMLGDLYLYELGRPDLAVKCFQDFRGSTRSGADTLYKLGQAYEQLGDRAQAAKFYEHVTSYESHPRAPDAREALYRLQSQ